MKLKCPYENCQYEWDYKGDSDFYATCPQCLRKVKIDKNKIDNEEDFEIESIEQEKSE